MVTNWSIVTMVSQIITFIVAVIYIRYDKLDLVVPLVSLCAPRGWLEVESYVKIAPLDIGFFFIHNDVDTSVQRSIPIVLVA